MCQTGSFGLCERVGFLYFFIILAATQKVACCRFLYIFSESGQSYFHQNLCEKRPNTLENKQLFFDPKLAQTTCFLYNTAEVWHINLILSENKVQYIL